MVAGSSRWFVALVLVTSCVSSSPSPSSTSSAAVAASGTAASTASSSVRPAPEHLALLVGLDHYSPAAGNRRPADLAGSCRDVAMVRELLEKRFGFGDDAIHVLTDEAATHARIVTEFKEWLIDRAGPGTEVLFWFSGHGSRCPDAAAGVGGEVGACDSTLATWDSRVPPVFAPDGKRVAAGGYDLTDDELHSLLRALCSKTERVTVVTDACHSGGVTRDDGPRVRFTNEFDRPLLFDDIRPFWPADVPFLEDGAPERSAPIPWVHIAACSFSEPAHEFVQTSADGTTRTNGALTWFLVQALERADPGETYEQLVRGVALDVSWFHREQQVQAEGALTRELFGAAFAPPLPGFSAAITPASTFVEVAAGSLQQLRIGARLRIENDRGSTIGEAEVCGVQPTASVARWIGERPQIEEPGSVRAIETRHGRGAAPLPIYLAGGSSLDPVAVALTRTADDQGGIDGVEVVRDPSQATPLELAIASSALELRVRAEPQLLRRVAAAPPWNDLRAALADEQRFRELLALGGERGHYQVSVALEPVAPGRIAALGAGHVAGRIEGAGDERGADGGGGGGGESGGESHRGGPGRHQSLVRVRDDPDAVDVVEVVVTLDRATASGPLFVSILCISEDRSVTLLYPAVNGARDNLIEPGRPLRVPISLAPTRLEGVDRDGVDRLLVLVTETFADLSQFVREADGSFGSAAEARGVVRGEASLPSSILDALAPMVTRSADGAADATTGSNAAEAPFGVAALDLQVVTR